MSITSTQPINEGIATEEVEECFLCGTRGTPLHPALRDHVFGAPGVWRMVECRHCALAWLDPRPTPADIGQIPTPHDIPPWLLFLLGTLALSKAGSVPNCRDGPNQWVEERAAPIRS